MRRDYADHYRELYTKHWWWRARENVLLREIEQHRPVDGWQSILDVGCGDALFFDRLGRFGSVWGVEPDGQMVDPNGKHRDRIHVGSLDSFHPPGRFRLILLLDVLEHIREPVGALRHARRLMEASGSLLVTLPAFRSVWTSHDDLNSHIDRYSLAKFRSLASEAGLVVVSSRYLFHWLFFAKLGTRVVELVARPEPRMPRVPSRWLNRLLTGAPIAESRLLAPFRLPFGSSLLAWCRAAV